MTWVTEPPSLLPSAERQAQLTALGLELPPSFALSPTAFAHILGSGGGESYLREKLALIEPDDPDSLMLCCFSARSEILKADFPDDLSSDLAQAYTWLSAEAGLANALVTVRPPGASWHEGGRHRGLEAISRAIATAYADALTRLVMHEGVRELDEALGRIPLLLIGRAMGWHCSGLLTNFEPKGGAEGFVVVLSTWGLAEDIARKELARDEYTVHKPGLERGCDALIRRRPGHKEFRLDFDIDAGRMRHAEVPHERVRELTLTSEEALRLARAALLFDGPIELDWGMEEGWSRQLHLLGARPGSPPAVPPLRLYQLHQHGAVLVEGKAVGTGLAVGRVRVIEERSQLASLVPGEILVARKTEPDWEPYFRQAGAIITEQDTRVSHATILARELGIPALLEASGSSLFLDTGQLVTVACCQGETGHVYDGESSFDLEEFDAHRLPPLKAELAVSLSMPERALAEARRPWSGAGLVRSEFMLSGWVRIHPLALCYPERLAPEVLGTVNRLTRGYESKGEYFVDQMSQGIATIASAFWPRPVLLRLSDLKTHEYGKMVGGERFEPAESNPVLGFRGAARYLDHDYRPAFLLELSAIRRVRQQMGLSNLHLMIPFCRTPEEAEEVLEIMAEAGLERGHDGLQVWAMAELPSNVMLAEEFAQLFDGLSIGSNDLTQLTLGVDRDNRRLGGAFDEIHPAMMAAYQRIIEAAHAAGKKVSFCGQVASDDPMLCATLVEMGIDAISVVPDAFTSVLSGLRDGQAFR